MLLCCSSLFVSSDMQFFFRLLLSIFMFFWWFNPHKEHMHKSMQLKPCKQANIILEPTLPSSQGFEGMNLKNSFPGCNWLHGCNCFSAPYFWAFPFPPQSLRVAEGEVFAQHFRAGRIPSPWCVMNILLYCYVIYAKGSRLKAPSLHPLISGSGAWSALISWVFILLYKH